MNHEILAALPAGADANKLLLRAAILGRSPYWLDEATDPQTFDPRDVELGDVVPVIAWHDAIWFRDAGDTTAGHDGITCIVTSDGSRYFSIGIAAPGGGGGGGGDVPSTRTLTAGAGLVGGGDLTADRTFNIGSGTGITVAVDSIGLAAINSGALLANISGASAAPTGAALSAVLDALIGNTRGSVMVRGATTWGGLPLGTADLFLKSNGTDLIYATAGSGGGTAGVTAFNLRTGDVVPAAGDYTATQITNTGTGGIAASTVQAAINELDTEKVGTARTITAGAGLTGGGTLAADRTFDVGAGTGIAVVADSVGLATVAAGGILSNVTGTTAAPLPNALTAILDQAIGTTRGAIAVRGAAAWQTLTLGAIDNVLKSNGTDLVYGTVAAGGELLPLFNGVLRYSSATAIVLNPFSGNKLFINGTHKTIPAAGVTKTNAGLSAATFYYCYAFDSAGTLTLELATTAPATDATYGHRIKTGDATRTLVGMVRTNASNQFANSSQQRLVRTWVNRGAVVVGTPLVANRTTTSAPYVETDTADRLEYLVWSDEMICGALKGVFNCTITTNLYLGISVDGTFRAGDTHLGVDSVLCITVLPPTILGEGYHDLRLMIGTGGGSATLQASGSTGTQFTLGRDS